MLGVWPAGRTEAPEWCPGCGSRDLRLVSDGELTNLLCRACAACWEVRPEDVRRADPQTCPGCPSLTVCRTALVPYRALA